MSGTLVRMFEPFLGWAARRYQARVAVELKKYGLRYEDLLDPLENLDINEALNRLPQEVVDARNQRLKRASDISLKKEYMSPEMQALQTPYASYLQEALDQVEAEGKEKQLLGTSRSYQRSIP
eukprot:CAMPEP_0206138480 /NCGR_PEP_ID=MMETSP1473-20131121/3352_1 /ASSEMBLY_ACC=CAM_ASM_001109 /TAXON_ID=1461547 /ORGANISM="Stichococcus sp, Strain RCC1054" /LENGTH=122 /DNA_ID=CAMNT_0053531925 /DNA_START=112 /DNA_END=480 /DNA_ORIENTATION=-